MDCDRNDDGVTRKPSRFVGECRCLIGGHSLMPCPIALSKEARSRTIDKLRSKRIAAMMKTVSDSDVFNDSCSSDDKNSPEKSANEGKEIISNEQQQLLEKKRQLEEENSELLLKLTKCLRLCKRKVDTQSPKVCQPKLGQLRRAIDTAVYLAERIKSTSIRSTTALLAITQRASAIANQMYIADNVRSNSSYGCLVRIKNILTLASRVSAVINAYADKIASGDFKPLPKESKESAQSTSGSTEIETQVVQMDEADKPQASSDNFAIRKRTRFGGKCRYATGEQSSKPSHLAISKEARKAAFDRNRSKRIAAMMKKNNSSNDSGYDSDEFSDDSVCDDDTSSSNNESSDGNSSKVSEMKKKMREQTATFLIQLTKCLSTCKREVYTLSPSLVRPDIHKLIDAVDNALFTTERIKCVSVNSAASLKTMTQTAATIARVVYIPDSMHSAATRSSYHKLLRIRRFLNLALRVAAVMSAFTLKMFSSEFKWQATKTKESKPSNHGQGNSQQDVEEKSQSVKKVEPSPGKGCSSKENICDTTDSKLKPQKQVPSFKIPTSLGICKNSSNSPLSEVCAPAAKLKVNKCCRQAVLDDVIDVGVVVAKKPEEKQRAEATLKSVEKQSIFKSSCRKNRFSPYAGRPTLKKASHSTVSTETGPSKIHSSATNPQEKSNSVLSVSTNVSLSKPVQPVTTDTSFSKPTNKTEEQKHSQPQVAKEKQSRKAEISMDELSDLFGSKCSISESVNFYHSRMSFRDPGQNKLTGPVIPREQYPGVALQDGGVKFVLRESPLTKVLQHRKLLLQLDQLKQKISMDELADIFGSRCKISETVSMNYSNMSFRDPSGHELTGPVVPREQYPEIALQDGGVKFVLRESPLTKVLQHRKPEGKDLNILSQNMLNAPQADHTNPFSETSSTDCKQSLTPYSNSPAIAKQEHLLLFSDVETTIAPATTSTTMLKSVRRRLYPNLSNVLVSRKNVHNYGELDEYRRIVGANVEVLAMNNTKARPRLGKRTASEAGLPIPAAK